MTEIKKTTLEKLKEQQRNLARRIQQVQARAEKLERKKDTRRKILVGSYYLSLANTPEKMEQLKKLLGDFLKRDTDRALFELNPITEDEN